MVIYLFDGTFDGMLTAVFDSFVQKEEPELVCRPEEPLPLFYDKVYTVVTDVAKSERVWRKLSKVISRGALSAFTAAFLTNRPDYPTHAVRFVRRAVVAPPSIENDFSDASVRTPHRNRPDYPTHAARFVRRAEVAPPSIENDFSDASVRTPHRNRPDYPTHAARFVRRAEVAPPSIENDFSDASVRTPHRNRPDYPTHAARFIRRAEVAPPSIENDFSDASVLALYRESRRVKSEAHRMLQFVRFQKALDGTYFAMVDPLFDVLPMAISHFRDRFSDQPFIIYDKLRAYGYHFDGKDLHRMTLLTPPTPHHPEIPPSVPQIRPIGPISPPPPTLLPDKLPPSLLDPEELLFQKLWRTYFNAIAIPERTNPRKQRQDMPIRYWKYLPELTPEPLTIPTPPSD